MRKKITITKYIDGSILRDKNRRISLIERDDGGLDFRFDKISERTVKLKGEKNVSAFSLVDEKGISRTGIVLTKETLNYMMYLAENLIE